LLCQALHQDRILAFKGNADKRFRTRGAQDDPTHSIQLGLYGFHGIPDSRRLVEHLPAVITNRDINHRLREFSEAPGKLRQTSSRGHHDFQYLEGTDYAISRAGAVKAKQVTRRLTAKFPSITNQGAMYVPVPHG
jgi:hypothetical protein